jgi:hypothetical protein
VSGLNAISSFCEIFWNGPEGSGAARHRVRAADADNWATRIWLADFDLAFVTARLLAKEK